jgi:hypothetical protein
VPSPAPGIAQPDLDVRLRGHFAADETFETLREAASLPRNYEQYGVQVEQILKLLPDRRRRPPAPSP